MPDEITRDRVAALARCTFLPASWDKRFVQSVWGQDHDTLTPLQVATVDRLAWKYRRQMPKPLVPASDPSVALGMAAQALRS